MSVVKGRKPGWFLDKILGRDADEEAAAQPKAADATVEPLPEPPVLSPASVFEGQPDFTPAAEALELPAVPPTVVEASSDTPPPSKQVEELAGASLQPVTGAPEGGGPREPIPREAPEPSPSRPAQASPAQASTTTAAPETRNWWRRLADGMKRTSSTIGDSVTGLFTKRRLDRAMLDDLEDVLVGADLGIETATRITEAVAGGRYDREISPQEVKEVMAGEIEKVLRPVAHPLVPDTARKPFVLLMVGVNGAGKTTTIGKLARRFTDAGLKVILAAGDTFRAAAVEQLQIWGDRNGVPVIAQASGADPAAVVYDALQSAQARKIDVLLADTAGRLHTQSNLMDELKKIKRVLQRLDASAPDEVLLVLDASQGQNALQQAKLFNEALGVTGIVLTKLDGTAKGGIVLAIADQLRLPIRFIGIGETAEDFEVFDAANFVDAVLKTAATQ
jgi:fused signal recognition particle receptor